MRVFVAGATGAIGRALVPALLRAGHEVTGMTRSPERAAGLQAAGAAPVVCDALDRQAVELAVGSARPEVVVHELTELPARYRDLRKRAEATNRLRTEGTRNLVEAALGRGARRLVAQSIAFLYAPEGDAIKDEGARPWTDAPAPFDGAVAALLELERTVTEPAELEGLVLRYGAFYGPGTWYAPDGDIAEQVRRRRFPLIGGGAGLISWLHVEDAAAATVSAVEGGARGVYNVVDDEPVAYREWLPEYARLLGARPPRRVPAWLARLVAGSLAVSVMTEQRGASNRRATEELGWRPAYPGWRHGFAESLGSISP
jgi:nucleoside-diphosphate-sugar epimerase